MKQTPNINLPILEQGDKYLKETQNEAFSVIDREIAGLNSAISSLDNAEGSIIDTKNDVETLKNETNMLKASLNDMASNVIPNIQTSLDNITTLIKNSEELKTALSLGKKHLTLVEGVFNIDRELTLMDITIKGKNLENTIIKATTTLDNMLLLKGNITLENITIDCNNNSYSAYKTNELNDLIIKNVIVQNALSNFNGTYPINNACEIDGLNVYVDNLTVKNNKGHGLSLSPSRINSNYKIINSDFSNNGVGKQGIGLVNRVRNAGVNFKSILVNNCIAFNNGASGIGTHTANNIIISNCDCSNNGEHGICIMDGKNATITANKCNNNVASGLRIQGDFSTEEDSISGWNNAQITGNDFSSNSIGVSLGNKISNVNIVGNNLTNESSHTIYIQYFSDRTNCSNIIATGNIISSILTSPRKNAPVCGYIVDETIKFDNYDEDGNRITYYTLLGSKSFINTIDRIIGNNDNIIQSPTDYSTNWNMHGTLSGGIITSNTSGWYMYQRINYSQERFLSLILEFDKRSTTEESPSILLRFRKQDGGLIGDKGYRYNNFNDKITITWDMLEDIDRNILHQAKFIDLTITGTASMTIKPINIVGCFSNQLPVDRNSI